MSLREIVKRLKHYDPETIILFGSQARGTPRKNSDYDFLIIKQTDKRPVQRVSEVLDLFDYQTLIDPLVYTPEELAQAKKDNRFFIMNILKEGKVLYER